MTQESLSALSQLLHALTSHDNLSRASAEDTLEQSWVLKAPGELLVGLATLLTMDPQVSIRSFAPILLRRIALQPASQSDIPLLSTLPLAQTNLIQEHLLKSLLHEQEHSVRHKLCFTISDFARHWGDQWPGLLPVLYSTLQSPQASLREAGFSILGSEPLLLEKSPAAGDILLKGLQDAHVDVRLAAVKATANFLMETEPEVRDRLAGFVPEMIKTLPPILAQGDREDAIIDSLSYLIELAENFPKMYRPVLSQLIPFMAEIMANETLENCIVCTISLLSNTTYILGIVAHLDRNGARDDAQAIEFRFFRRSYPFGMDA